MTLRLLLADDHQMVLDGLKHLIEHESGMWVVAEALNGEEAYTLWLETAPDVAVLDLTMPLLNGLDAARRMVAERPDAKVLILSMHADPSYVREALKAGARGYLLKEAAASELLRAIRCVHRGELFVSASFGTSLLEEFVARLRQDDETRDNRLSARQREVLQLLAEGHTTKEIASRLHLSVKTIETYRAQIMHKLDLHSIAELTKYAIREGLTGLD